MSDQEWVPKFLSLKYGGKYLTYDEVTGGVAGGRLKFSSMEILNPLSRFEVVAMSTRPEDKVHIRCCYNNKFLVKKSVTENWIVAGADEPEEDLSKWSCTLMQPVKTSGGFSFRLAAGAGGGYLYSSRASADHNYLTASTSQDVFVAADMSSLVIFPRFVVFKGDNKRYLRRKTIENHQYLEFDHAYGDDSFYDQEVRYETFPTPEGNYRFKSVQTGKFWRRDTPNANNWVWADSTDTSNSNLNTVFKPINLLGMGKNNVIALQCVGNNKYCVRIPAKDGKWDCMDAMQTAVVKEARIQFDEAVRGREIYDVDYRLASSNVYDFSDLKSMTTYVTNHDAENQLTVQVSFSYSETDTMSWTSTNSWKLGVATTIKAGIPFVVDKEVKIMGEYNGSIAWSEEVVKIVTNTTGARPKVDPGKKLMVKLVVAMVALEIPFSYTQKDILMNGKTQETRFHDGIYKSVAKQYYWTSKPVAV